MLRIIGGAIVAWGFLDLGLSWAGTDLYGEIGISIPDAIYPYTHWIAFAIGGAISAIGKSLQDGGETEE